MDKVSRRDFIKIIFTMMCYPAVKPLMEAVCSPAIYWHGNRETQVIGITFDDCYNYDQLIDLESFLDANPAVQVTFFPTGLGLLNPTSKDPEIWKRLLNKGHEIGYHSYSHTSPSSISWGKTLSEFIAWKNTLSKILGKEIITQYARPPFGDLSWNFLNLCCNQNLSVVMWSQNWSLVHKTNYFELKNTQNGDIVLLHIREQDLQNFKDCVPRVQDMGLRMVNLTTLLEEKSTPPNPPHKISNSEESICYTYGKNNSICTR